MGNVFDKFKKAPKNADPTIQILYDYEKHYMDLVKSYRREIEFINQLHASHTQEVKNFYEKDLPAIQKKLASEPIDDEVRREWLKHLENHMNKSFEMSGHFIGILTTKNLDEFNAAIREKIFGGNV
ncbi:MAG: hypothetical protein IJS81_11990 [Selenomonadaceae bacterium]|nr:hypothetical protein [Selenomonadaceae bacterium]